MYEESEILRERLRAERHIQPSRGAASGLLLFGGYAGTVMADAYGVYQKLEKAGGRQTYFDQDGPGEG